MVLFIMYFKIAYILLVGRAERIPIPKVLIGISGVLAFLCLLFGLLPQLQLLILVWRWKRKVFILAGKRIRKWFQKSMEIFSIKNSLNDIWKIIFNIFKLFWIRIFKLNYCFMISKALSFCFSISAKLSALFW